jgi:hypothetical protein
MNKHEDTSLTGASDTWLTIADTQVRVADVLRLLAASNSYKEVMMAFPELSTRDISVALQHTAAILEVLDVQRDSAVFISASLALAVRDFDQQPPQIVESRGTPWEEITGLMGLMKGK